MSSLQRNNFISKSPNRLSLSLHEQYSLENLCLFQVLSLSTSIASVPTLILISSNIIILVLKSPLNLAYTPHLFHCFRCSCPYLCYMDFPVIITPDSQPQICPLLYSFQCFIPPLPSYSHVVSSF